MVQRLVAILAALACIGNASGAQSVEWNAGVARVKITPREPIWMSGYVARTTPARGVRHDLWAKALVLDAGDGQRAVLVTMDLVGIDRELSLAIRRRIEERHKTPRSAIVLAASHTHAGPVVGANLAPMFDFDDEQRAQVDRYAEKLADDLVAVVAAAIDDLAPAELSWSLGAATFAVNRRNNPKAEVAQRRTENRLAGPVDHDVPVLALRSAEGELRAIVAGYACHATVLNDDLWSGDWPGAAQSEIERRHPGTTALYWCGCGADQNPLPRRLPELVDEYGRQFADAVDAALAKPGRAITPALTTAYEEIDLPFDALPTRAELETQAAGSDVQARRAQRLLATWDRDGRLSPTYPYPMQLWRLGDEVSWYFLGGEVVVDYAFAIKQRLGVEGVWIAAYANDVMGYIPSRRVLAEGGYEGRDSGLYYGLPTTWSPDVERVILEAVERLRKP